METLSQTPDTSTLPADGLQLSNLQERMTALLNQKLSAKNQSQSQPADTLNEDCENLKLIALARSFGAKETDYEEGVFVAQFENKDALNHFADALDNADYVYSYEIRIEGEEGSVSAFDTLPAEIRAVVIVYIDEDYVDYGYYEVDEDDPDGIEGDDNGASTQQLTEVKRRIKVNSRGVKRIKMQCKPGYKWDVNARACVKITGDQLAKNRKSHRRAILTKKAMGSAFKARVIRKTKKAMRFRKALGVKNG
jgi:hypothetical protein